ncbi:MAG TPA: hypothetical protein VJP79_08795 [Nitrososphaera sp.]|nr:hypothetical protein [Nitrososphaera sp.]
MVPGKRNSALLAKIEDILKRDPSRMWSREEILNLVTPGEADGEVEQLLAELEVSSSMKEDGDRSDVYATCRGGTVYYKWNKAT